MKVLISGGKGQVGKDLAAVLSARHSVAALDKTELDITRAEGISDVLQTLRPDYVVNAAAFTKVDACETERETARRVNAEGPGLLAAACRKRDIPLLHFSTDYVFDGRKPSAEAYSEDDAPDPLSYYGLSKLEGERQIEASGCRFVILRTAWVYGRSGANFLKTILRRALLGEPLRVVDDQFGAPTWSYRIAQQVRRLLENEARGLFHAAAEGKTTWYEVAKAFLSEMQVSAPLSPCTTLEYPTPARRPANSRLENRRLRQAGLGEMKDWREDLAEFVKLHRDTLLEEAGRS